MAVAFGSIGPSAAGAVSTTSSISWSHTLGANETTVLVRLTLSASPVTFSGVTISTITCGGNPMNFLGKIESGGSGVGSGGQFLYGITGVTAGTSQTISVTTNTTPSTGGGWLGFSESYTGAAGFGTAVTATGVAATSGSIAVTTGSANSMVSAGFCDGSGGETWTAGTQRFKLDHDSGTAAGNTTGATSPGTGGTVTFTWTMASDDYGAIAVEVLAASVGAGLPLVPMLTRHPGRTFRNKYQKERQYQNMDRIGPVPPPPPTGAPVIVALGTSTPGVPVNASFFMDQYGKPTLMMADNPWALIPNAGRWNGSGGSTWQNDLDNYCNSRGSQGFTVIYLDPLGNSENNGAFADGRTFDGVFPFTVNGTAGTTASIASTAVVGLNDTFWQRVDYFLAACARNGMTALLNVAYSGPGDFAVGGAYANFTTTHWTQYGTALGQRYGATRNVLWATGNDNQGTGLDASFSALLTGLRAGGANQVISSHYAPEMTSRYATDTNAGQPWGQANAQWNLGYSYEPTYFVTEYMYKETQSPDNASALLPVIWGDGYFYQGNTAQFELGMRQMAWWALSSGARGINTGSEGIWQWASSAPAAVTSENWYNSQAKIARNLVESLPGWFNLIPDTGNVFITAGRGTRSTGTTSGGGGAQYGAATTDNYVSGSITPDGTLALIYFSEGAHTNTITINQSKLVSGYTATWVDPYNGNTHAATVGSTYSPNSLGTNGSGTYHDWVLVLGPAVGGSSTISGTLSLAALSTLSNPNSVEIAPASFIAGLADLVPGATQGSGLPLAGSAALSGFTVQGSGTAFGGQATITPTAVQGSSTGFSAASSWAVKAVQQAGLSLASAASATFSAGSAVAGTIAFAAQSAFTALATQLSKVDLPGASSLGSSATQGAGTSMSGDSSLGASATQLASAAFTAASSFTAKATQLATTAFSSASSLVLSAAGSVTGTITMAANAALQSAAVQQAGSAFTSAATFAANAAQQAGLSMPSASTFSAKATQLATVTLPSAANGVWVAGGAVLGTITMAASSVWQSSAVQQAVAAFSANSQFTAKLTQGASMAFQASASLAASFTRTATVAFSAASSWAGSLYTGTLYGRLKAGGRALGSRIGRGKSPGNRVGGRDE